MNTPTTLPEFALSIRQPWAWLILHSGKDIENRTWSTLLKGRFLIHAAKGMTVDEYHLAKIYSATIRGPTKLPEFWEFERGGIIGSVEMLGCVTGWESPWFTGPVGFVLRDPQPLPFQPCRGALRFFRPKIGEGMP